MAKMTTEEAFVKVLQMHGIEHSFGIIGSAFMPISDLFPEAGITFWDVAHETNGGLIADGYTRATGKMSMVIAQNGQGYYRTCYTNKNCLLESYSVTISYTTSCKQNYGPRWFSRSRANEFI